MGITVGDLRNSDRDATHSVRVLPLKYTQRPQPQSAKTLVLYFKDNSFDDMLTTTADQDRTAYNRAQHNQTIFREIFTVCKGQWWCSSACMHHQCPHRPVFDLPARGCHEPWSVCIPARRTQGVGYEAMARLITFLMSSASSLRILFSVDQTFCAPLNQTYPSMQQAFLMSAAHMVANIDANHPLRCRW